MDNIQVEIYDPKLVLENERGERTEITISANVILRGNANVAGLALKEAYDRCFKLLKKVGKLNA